MAMKVIRRTTLPLSIVFRRSESTENDSDQASVMELHQEQLADVGLGLSSVNITILHAMVSVPL